VSEIAPARATALLDAPEPEVTGLARSVLRDRSVRVGLTVVGIVVLLALAAPLVAALVGHGPTQQFQSEALDSSGVPIGPRASFWLGADGNGRDVLVRVLYGARVSLLVGIPATTVAMLVGTTVGLLAGFFGGRVDQALSQVTDVVLSFPFVVTALSLVALNRTEEGSSRVSPVLLVIGIVAAFSWTYFARLTRGLTAELRARPFVEASETIGSGSWRIIRRDVLPNIAPAVIVYWAVQLPTNIVAEATLSFLGIGVQAPTPSWGNMIADAQRTSLYQVQPWFLIGPAVGLVATVVGFNAISNGVRNVLDPHHGTR
jgi:peptide/nickel transport system permease protein